MKQSMNMILNFVKEENGATAVEYGIMVSLIAAVIFTVVETLGGKVVGLFTTMTNASW